MATIYVRTNGNDATGTGLTGAPYLTLNKAFSVAASGDVILVGDGTYAEDSGSGYLSVGNRSFASRTLVAPESGLPDKVIVTGTSGTNAVVMGSTTNLQWDQITFRGQSVTCAITFRFIGDCSNITFTRCRFTVYSSASQTNNCVNTAWSTGSWTPDNIVFDSCVFDQIGPYTAAGIVMDGSTCTAGAGPIEVRGCDIRVGGPGLRLLGAVDARIHGNTVDSFYPGTANHAIQLGVDGATGALCTGAITGNYARTVNGHSMVVGAGCNGVHVFGNRVHGGANSTSGQGLVVKEAQNVRIEDNTITSGYLSGVYFKAAVDCQAISNRIYCEHANASAIRVGVNPEDSLPCQRITVRRNLVVASAGTVFGWDAAAGDSGGSVCDDNVYSTRGTGALGTVRGTTVTTLSGIRAAWSGYSNPNNDRHSRLGATNVPYGGAPTALLP